MSILLKTSSEPWSPFTKTWYLTTTGKSNRNKIAKETQQHR